MALNKILLLSPVRHVRHRSQIWDIVQEDARIDEQPILTACL